MPSSGMKNSSPNSRPQNAPPSAPAPVRLRSCSVLGFLRSGGQVTIAPSTTWISSCFCSRSRTCRALRAPPSESNFQTVNVVMPPSSDPSGVPITPWIDQVAWTSPGAGEPVPRYLGGETRGRETASG